MQMEHTYCLVKETEPRSNECDGIIMCNEKMPSIKLEFALPRKASHRTCSAVKTCLQYVCLGVIVCAVLFLLQQNNELKRKMEVEQHKSSLEGYTSEALRSEHKNNYFDEITKQIQNYGPGLPNIMNESSDNARPTDHSEVDKGKQIPGSNPDLIRRHFFHIGMRDETRMQDCVHSNMKNSFPDIDYAFLGYDAPRGYPLAHGHDPGFTFPIFHADYTNGKQTADCRYRVPKGLVVVPDVSCVTSFTSDIIQTIDQLKKTLLISANFGGSISEKAFSASEEFKQMSIDLNTRESVYIISSASCNYYFSKLQRENPPPFTDNFVNWITKLNASESDSLYLQFIKTFGTHFPTEIMFGSRFIRQYKMKRAIFQKKRKNKHVSIINQASLSGLYRANGSLNLSEEERKAIAEFSKPVETKTIAVGAAPPSNGDTMVWAASVKNNPVPSKYKLEPIENLFQEKFMCKLNVAYETIATKLKTLKALYHEKIASENLFSKLQDLTNQRFTKMLTVENGGHFGQWFEPQFCPARTFAIGFRMKYEANKGEDGDSTGLNGISLLCSNRRGIQVKKQKRVTSKSGNRGDWIGKVTCPRKNGIPNFLQSFSLMVQQPNSNDDTMVNGVRFTCRDLQWTQSLQTIDKRIAHMKGQFGIWSEACSKGSAICGLQTRVEHYKPLEDNTTLNDMNDIRFFCCVLK